MVGRQGWPGCGRLAGSSRSLPGIGIKGRHCAGISGKCSVARANVFSLGGDVFSFGADVFSFRGDVFSLGVNVSSLLARCVQFLGDVSSSRRWPWLGMGRGRKRRFIASAAPGMTGGGQRLGDRRRHGSLAGRVCGGACCSTRARRTSGAALRGWR